MKFTERRDSHFFEFAVDHDLTNGHELIVDDENKIFRILKSLLQSINQPHVDHDTTVSHYSFASVRQKSDRSPIKSLSLKMIG